MNQKLEAKWHIVKVKAQAMPSGESSDDKYKGKGNGSLDARPLAITKESWNTEERVRRAKKENDRLI